MIFVLDSFFFYWLHSLYCTFKLLLLYKNNNYYFLQILKMWMCKFMTNLVSFFFFQEMETKMAFFLFFLETTIHMLLQVVWIVWQNWGNKIIFGCIRLNFLVHASGTQFLRDCYLQNCQKRRWCRYDGIWGKKLLTVKCRITPLASCCLCTSIIGMFTGLGPGLTSPVRIQLSIQSLSPSSPTLPISLSFALGFSSLCFPWL